MLDLYSGGAGFNSSTPLGRSELNSSAALCKWLFDLHPASWVFRLLIKVIIKHYWIAIEIALCKYIIISSITALSLSPSVSLP